jgi:hypothetical protein
VELQIILLDADRREHYNKRSKNPDRLASESSSRNLKSEGSQVAQPGDSPGYIHTHEAGVGVLGSMPLKCHFFPFAERHANRATKSPRE